MFFSDPWLKKSKKKKAPKPKKVKQKKEKKAKKNKKKKKGDEFDDIDNKFDRALEAAGLKSNSNGGLGSGAGSGKHCLITFFFRFSKVISLHVCHKNKERHTAHTIVS